MKPPASSAMSRSALEDMDRFALLAPMSCRRSRRLSPPRPTAAAAGTAPAFAAATLASFPAVPLLALGSRRARQRWRHVASARVRVFFPQEHLARQLDAILIVDRNDFHPQDVA